MDEMTTNEYITEEVQDSVTYEQTIQCHDDFTNFDLRGVMACLPQAGMHSVEMQQPETLAPQRSLHGTLSNGTDLHANWLEKTGALSRGRVKCWSWRVRTRHGRAGARRGQS